MKFTLKNLIKRMKKHDGNLYLAKLKKVELPDNLIVPGNLYLNYSDIKMLPKNLTVVGDLILCGSNIAELPECLKVGGNLDITGTDINSFPKDLKVDKLVFTEYNQVPEISNGLNIIPIFALH